MRVRWFDPGSTRCVIRVTAITCALERVASWDLGYGTPGQLGFPIPLGPILRKCHFEESRQTSDSVG
jgi:hypothetical protein